VIDAFPSAASDGTVDRRSLADIIETDPEAIGRLEAIVHPKVQEAARKFVASAGEHGAPVAILEIPLLLETGSDALCDKILVTAAPEPVRDARVAARGTMSPALYRRLLDRQIPEEDKVHRADYVVDTDVDLDDLRRRIGDIIVELRAEGSRG
jgi:dephospho-CoA kinase